MPVTSVSPGHAVSRTTSSGTAPVTPASPGMISLESLLSAMNRASAAPNANASSSNTISRNYINSRLNASAATRSATAASVPKDLTADEMKRIAKSGTTANIKAHLGGINTACRDFHVDTNLKKAHFLAQVIHESGSFKYTSEIGASNTDYGGFKGRGLIQLTGKKNYQDYGAYVGKDFTSTLAKKQLLEKNPDAAKSAGWFWDQSAKLNDEADDNDFIGITFKVNGGFNGYNDRLTALKDGIKELCPNENISTDYAFADSLVAENKKGSFGWGLWHDPGLEKKGCTKDAAKALEGYQNFIKLHNDEGKPKLTDKWYGYKGANIRSFVEGRIKEMKKLV
jgi:predicted chitinase